jgi:hypothetical protein
MANMWMYRYGRTFVSIPGSFLMAGHQFGPQMIWGGHSGDTGFPRLAQLGNQQLQCTIYLEGMEGSKL